MVVGRGRLGARSAAVAPPGGVSGDEEAEAKAGRESWRHQSEAPVQKHQRGGGQSQDLDTARNTPRPAGQNQQGQREDQSEEEEEGQGGGEEEEAGTAGGGRHSNEVS